MQKMMGLMRKCIDDYHMISPGDKIAVGVSGGKDSLTLLTVLAALRSYYPAPFELTAITIDMGLAVMWFFMEPLRLTGKQGSGLRRKA